MRTIRAWRRLASFAPGRVLTYGIEQPAVFRAENIEDRGALGSTFDYVSPEGRECGWNWRWRAGM